MYQGKENAKHHSEVRFLFLVSMNRKIKRSDVCIYESRSEWVSILVSWSRSPVIFVRWMKVPSYFLPYSTTFPCVFPPQRKVVDGRDSFPEATDTHTLNGRPTTSLKHEWSEIHIDTVVMFYINFSIVRNFLSSFFIAFQRERLVCSSLDFTPKISIIDLNVNIAYFHSHDSLQSKLFL